MESRLVWVRRLGLASVLLTILIMTSGSWVKANGAGLACPDWPACYGTWLPPFPSAEDGGTYQGAPIGFTQAQILYEWAHRAIVSLAFLPILAFAIMAAGGQNFAKRLRVLPALAVGLYLFQAILGAVTVVAKNPPWATTWHLFNATLLLVTLTVATCYAYLLKPSPALVQRKFQFTPSVHAARRGFTYPGTEGLVAPAPEEPSGPFPGEANREGRHGR